MISYKPFQKLLIDRSLKKQDVMKAASISNATMAKLNTNEYVSLEVVDKLCAALNCQPGDIMEYVPTNKERLANCGLDRNGQSDADQLNHIAKIVDVSPDMILMAGEVLKKGTPGIIEAVDKGELHLLDAVDMINNPQSTKKLKQDRSTQRKNKPAQD